MPAQRRPLLRRLRTLGAPVLVLACALLLTACGTDGESSRPDKAADLWIAGAPGAADVGAYLAVARGYTDAEGVTLQLTPGSSAADVIDALKTGRAQFGVLDIHDLAAANDAGADLVAVMAIVQRPLAGIVTTAAIRRPRDLEGHRVALTGYPAEETVLDTMVKADGGNPDKVKRGLIPQAAALFREGQYAGLTGPWPAARALYGAEVPGVRDFPADEYGVPPYPELVLVTPRTTVQDDPALVSALVAALQRGYREGIADPDSAVGALTDAVPDARRAAVSAELDDIQPLFQASTGKVGTFDMDQLRAWAAWEGRTGLALKAPDVAEVFLPRFALASAAKAAETSGQ